ncbi:antirestriction protein ArdA (plasmid) [Leclercia adecarboxylata]|uniref:antirestriction protein ArdA n=1 Tax=Leclercia adecarboxylata TaxID=83655 RepID=UPI002029BC7B|nr:antirestriction protein ArdA [Leclercia adecarboxylata]URO01579.1 antirestriction protein ArdA [Leclercia adecarboxylata]
MSTVTTPAVYVGTYHKYNCGSIAGAWLDLTEFDSSEEFYERCRELHANEADPEFMFQDWEGFPADMASEGHIKWEFIDGFKQASEEGREAAFLAFVELFSSTDYDQFDNAYMGEAKDEETYAQEYLDISGLLNGIPDCVARYFDLEAYARDLFMGEFRFYDGHVFNMTF